MANRKDGKKKEAKPVPGGRKGIASLRKYRRLYIAGESFRYEWQQHEVKEFIEAYVDLRQSGMDGPSIVLDLSKLFKRQPEEVAILVMDLGERGYIGQKGRGVNPRPFSIDDCE